MGKNKRSTYSKVEFPNMFAFLGLSFFLIV